MVYEQSGITHTTKQKKMVKENEETIINGILTTISIILWFCSITANIRLFQYSKRKWAHDRTIGNTMSYAVTVSNLSACMIAMPMHVTKLMMENYDLRYGGAYICLLRYTATMTTTDMTLLFLTVLLIDRHDKIVLVPYGKRPRINSSNKKKCIAIILSVVVVSNLFMFVGYVGHITNLHLSPCEKNSHDQVSRVMTYLESIKTCAIAIPCIVIMCRAISKIQHKIKAIDNGTPRFQSTQKKVRQTYYYCTFFLIFWVPFGAMVILGEEVVSQQFYSTWLNIGYTISYGYVLALPLVSALTDGNFYCIKRQNHIQRLSTTREISSIPGPSFNMQNFQTQQRHNSDVKLKSFCNSNQTTKHI